MSSCRHVPIGRRYVRCISDLASFCGHSIQHIPRTRQEAAQSGKEANKLARHYGYWPARKPKMAHTPPFMQKSSDSQARSHRSGPSEKGGVQASHSFILVGICIVLCYCWRNYPTHPIGNHSLQEEGVRFMPQANSAPLVLFGSRSSTLTLRTSINILFPATCEQP